MKSAKLCSAINPLCTDLGSHISFLLHVFTLVMMVTIGVFVPLLSALLTVNVLSHTNLVQPVPHGSLHLFLPLVNLYASRYPSLQGIPAFFGQRLFLPRLLTLCTYTAVWAGLSLWSTMRCFPSCCNNVLESLHPVLWERSCPKPCSHRGIYPT